MMFDIKSCGIIERICVLDLEAELAARALLDTCCRCLWRILLLIMLAL
jgi:hypothetical protein